MAGQHESPEYRALQKHYTDLAVAILQGDVPGTLFANNVINDDTLEAASSQAKTTREKGATVMKNVRDSLRLNPPEVFEHVCDALSKEDSAKHLLDELKGW